MKSLLPLLFSLLLVACKHPLAIVGQGDIVDLNGSDFGCSLEEFNAGAANCLENEVSGDYRVNYAGVAREGWRFSHWEGGCRKSTFACRIGIEGTWVAYWDENFSDATIPALTAVFVEVDPGEEPGETVWPSIDRIALPDVEAEVDEILARMTLAEKVGQMVMAEIQSASAEDVAEYELGAVLNGGGSWPQNNRMAAAADWVAMADQFYLASTDTSDGGVGVPVLWGTDAVHGHNNVRGATVFPHNIGLGATNNPQLLRQIGAATAREVAATGIDWTFAPTLAVARDDRWGRTYEGFSETPDLVRRLARPLVEGLQGEAGAGDLFGPGRVMATAKHFIGDGGTRNGVDQGDTVVGETVLRDLHAQGYYAALSAGAQVVMATFNSWNGDKVHGSAQLLTEVLKQQMGFDGLVLGDWNGHGQVSGCSERRCAEAINAGVDMIMVPQAWLAFIDNTIDDVESGAIPMSRIDDAVRRILRVKLRAGLFEKGLPSSRAYAGDATVTGHEDHRAVARQAVRESLVLLKNSAGLLPLRRDLNLLVAGSGADSIPMQSGGWTMTWQGTGTSNSDFPGATTIAAGIESVVEAAGGSAVVSEDGNFPGGTPDAAVVVIGETPYAEGQGDLSDLEYQRGNKTDLALLRNLRDQGIPVVTIFLSGRPLWVNPELNASDAFVAAWLPGSEGAGVADVLFRDANDEIQHDFSGKLAYSWPKQASQVSLNQGDADYDPLFGYGFGLTYEDVDTLGDDLDEGPGGGSTSGSPIPVPGRIEAESFSAMQGIQLENTTDTGGGMNIGYVDPGDWFEFSIVVDAPGDYLVEYRVASLDGSDGFSVAIDGVPVDSQSVPRTAGWQNWTTLSRTLTLQAGEQTLRIDATGGLWNMNWIDIR